MARKRYTAEEIIGHLRTIEIETGKGLGIAEACRKMGITEQTYYRWKKEYGGLRIDQAKRLKSPNLVSLSYRAYEQAWRYPEWSCHHASSACHGREQRR